jgi:WD40 repeat protein
MVHLIRPVVEDGIFVNWSTKVFDGHEGQIYQLAFDEKRRRIITGGQDLSVFIFDEDTGEILHKLQLEELVSCMKFDPIRNILAVGSNDSCVRVWYVLELYSFNCHCSKHSSANKGPEYHGPVIEAHWLRIYLRT